MRVHALMLCVRDFLDGDKGEKLVKKNGFLARKHSSFSTPWPPFFCQDIKNTYNCSFKNL